jgi:hypothetical protein
VAYGEFLRKARLMLQRWEETSNWSTGEVPGAGDLVSISGSVAFRVGLPYFQQDKC